MINLISNPDKSVFVFLWIIIFLIGIAMTQQVMASKMTMQLQKNRLKGAQKGHELLKRKVDALKKQFRTTMLNLIETKKSMGKQFADSLMSLAEANYAAGEFRFFAIPNVIVETWWIR